MAEIKKSSNEEQLLYIIAEEFGDDKEGWEQLAVEMVKAMSDTQAKEILGYIAKNWDIDTMGYEASTKKSKIKKERDLWSKVDLLKIRLGRDPFIEETYHALSTDVANETLDYIARNWDIDLEYNDYEASAKKSKIDKAVGDYVSGFALKGVADHIKYLYDHYFVEIMENGSDNRPDLGVDWWTSEYIADELEKQIPTIERICGDLRSYANSGERQPIEVWQREMKSTKKSNTKSFNEMIKEQRKQYKDKKVL